MWKSTKAKVNVKSIDNKNKNMSLALHYKILKYIKNRFPNPKEPIILVGEICDKSFKETKKLLWADGIYKKFYGKEFIILDDIVKLKNIKKRTKENKAVYFGFLNDFEYYWSDKIQYNTDKPIYYIINNSETNTRGLNSEYFNKSKLEGIKKLRTDIYGKKHNLVSNPPSLRS